MNSMDMMNMKRRTEIGIYIDWSIKSVGKQDCTLL